MSCVLSVFLACCVYFVLSPVFSCVRFLLFVRVYIYFSVFLIHRFVCFVLLVSLRVANPLTTPMVYPFTTIITFLFCKNKFLNVLAVSSALKLVVSAGRLPNQIFEYRAAYCFASLVTINDTRRVFVSFLSARHAQATTYSLSQTRKCSLIKHASHTVWFTSPTNRRLPTLNLPCFQYSPCLGLEDGSGVSGGYSRVPLGGRYVIVFSSCS